MPKVRQIGPLEKVALSIRDLAIAKAPSDRGTLKQKIKSANPLSKMIKQTNDLGIEISLDYGPAGATYGEYWNDPYGSKKIWKGKKSRTYTTKKRYPQHWNFAIDAMNDTEINLAFQAYLDSLGDYVIGELEIELEKQ